MTAFTKHNRSVFSDHLIKEAEGLELLRRTVSENNIPYLRIPRVDFVNEQVLQIEKIDIASATPELMRRLGKGLALLHKVPQSHFGFEENNYIGLSVQENQIAPNWGEFFIDHRLGFQINLIKDRAVKNHFEQILEQSKDNLTGFLNANSDYPSLVHGDLWSGNVLFDFSNIWLIDPAVYFADREVDVAMTEMFTGFSAEFYQAYHQNHALSSVYNQKKVIYNLYHYLNHYNLFGSGYLSACERGFDLIESLT